MADGAEGTNARRNKVRVRTSVKKIHTPNFFPYKLTVPGSRNSLPGVSDHCPIFIFRCRECLIFKRVALDIAHILPRKGGEIRRDSRGYVLQAQSGGPNAGLD